MCVRQASLHIVPDDDDVPEKASLPVQTDGHPQVGTPRPAPHVARSKTDQKAEEAALYLGPATAEVLPSIRPEKEVVDLEIRIFKLSTRQISRGVEYSYPGDGSGRRVKRPLHEDGSAPRPERRWGGTDDWRTVAQLNHAGPVHRNPVHQPCPSATREA